jgi:hypothetical protein
MENQSLYMKTFTSQHSSHTLPHTQHSSHTALAHTQLLLTQLLLTYCSLLLLAHIASDFGTTPLFSVFAGSRVTPPRFLVFSRDLKKVAHRLTHCLTHCLTQLFALAHTLPHSLLTPLLQLAHTACSHIIRAFGFALLGLLGLLGYHPLLTAFVVFVLSLLFLALGCCSFLH